MGIVVKCTLKLFDLVERSGIVSEKSVPLSGINGDLKRQYTFKVLFEKMQIVVNRIFFRKIVHHIPIHVNKGHAPYKYECNNSCNNVNGRTMMLHQFVNIFQ